ncbi:MAG TPA: response regulator transcription factor [Candidatus Obscuribacterales bacterium]
MRILLIDDMPAMREHAVRLLHQLLGQDVQIVQATSGTEGLHMSKSMSPDLIILDISMPDMSGIAVAQEIWKEHQQQKIIFWSQYHKEAYVRAIGKNLPDEAVHGYAIKGELDENFLHAVDSVLLKDNSYIDPIVRGVQNRLKSKDGSVSDLEYETLIDIACGLTDRAIAQRRHVSVRAVQKRISSLIEKLIKNQDGEIKDITGTELLNPRTRVLTIAFKRGLVTTEDLEEANSEFFKWLRKEFDETIQDTTLVR